MDCTFDAERLFGPAVAACRRAFDFTLFFEEVFFKLLPSALFLAAAAFRIAVLVRNSPRVRFGSLYLAKIVRAHLNRGRILRLPRAGAAGPRVRRLRGSNPGHNRRRGAVLHRIRGARRPAAPRARALRPRLGRPGALPARHAAAAVGLASLLAQLGILVLEGRGKRRWRIDGRAATPEECASFLSRSLLAWLNPLFVKGYRGRLTDADLRIIDGDLSAEVLEPKFKRLLSAKKFGRYGLVRLTFESLGLYSLAPVPPRLALGAFTFAQPFLASALIDFLDRGGNAPKSHGYGLIGASFLVYTGIAISTGWYYYMTYKMAIKVKGGLITAISHKLLKVKQEKGVESTVLTLMIADIQRIAVALRFAQEIWIAPIETAIGTWLLWRQIGPSSLAVLGIVLGECAVVLSIRLRNG
ncbi:putative ABC multidrug [Rosellinia necatrix]|uniref:Putative ABC multidrug n=1 Tax=Rosellinia necatrix TaxID=77044 RepID=A0A1S8AAJ7_ROSNE|nr:putative ABC multidrug [Rosellinia necatrix]